jgi:hypothetical protein
MLNTTTSCTECTPCDLSEPNCTTTSYLYPSTPLNDANGNLIGNIDPNGYRIYTIGWFASHICQNGFFNSCNPKPSDTNSVRIIDQFIKIEMAGIPYWPVPAQVPDTPGTSDNDYYFGYLCANGTVAYDIQNCKCADDNPPSPLDFGICASTANAIGPTPYSPLGTIKILKDGYYRLQMVIDDFSPSCPAVKNADGFFKYLPKIGVYQYDDITKLGTFNNGYLITANFPTGCAQGTQGDSGSCFGTYTFSVLGTSFKIWWPNSDDGSSLVAPPVQQTDQGDTFYNTWYLYSGNILQFVIQNTCNGSGDYTNPGNFQGVIRITPQF